MDNCGGVVACVFALERVADDAQTEPAVDIALCDACVYRVLKTAADNMYVLPDLGEDDRHARVLTYRHAQLVGAVEVAYDVPEDALADGALLGALSFFYAFAHSAGEVKIGFRAELCNGGGYFFGINFAHDIIPFQKQCFRLPL